MVRSPLALVARSAKQRAEGGTRQSFFPRLILAISLGEGKSSSEEEPTRLMVVVSIGLGIRGERRLGFFMQLAANTE